MGHHLDIEGGAFSFASHGNPLSRWRKRRQERVQNNMNREKALENLKHHYNWPHELFVAMLGETVGYSEGYWIDGTKTLDQAKYNSFEYVCRRLRLTEPGLRVVEVGTGWGYLPCLLTDKYKADVTLYSMPIPEQNDYLRARLKKYGFEESVRILERDHRDLVHEPEYYDRYVSLGVFEHMGNDCYEDWVKSTATSLKPGGIGVATFSGFYQKVPTSLLTLKYIFPGGQLVGLSYLLELMEKHGLVVLDVENWWPYYQRSIIAWRENLFKAWPTLAEARPDIYTDRMFRIWDMYLSCTIDAFDDSLNDYIITFVKGRERHAYPLYKKFLFDEPYATGDMVPPTYPLDSGEVPTDLAIHPEALAENIGVASETAT